MSVKEKLIIMRVLFVLFAFCLTAALIYTVGFVSTDATYPAPLEPNTEANADSADVPLDASPVPSEAYFPVRLTFAGSCTTGSMFGSASYGTFNDVLASVGAGYFLEEVNDLFTADDLTFAGCDVVLSDNGELKAADRETPVWYRGSSSAAEIFAEGGVDVLFLHSFHTWDYGEAGYDDTKASLETAGLLWSDQGKAVYSEIAGVSVAAYDRYVDDETDAEAVLAWLAGAAEAHDYVAVYITTPETGTYLPDEARQAMFRSFIDAGADLVVGTDTAKIQPFEPWGDGAILYSAGALLDGKTIYPERHTVLLDTELHVVDGEIREVEYTLIPCLTYDEEHDWRPVPLEDAEEYAVVMDFLNGNRDTPEMG